MQGDEFEIERVLSAAAILALKSPSFDPKQRDGHRLQRGVLPT
jgi:hypothetical protein